MRRRVRKGATIAAALATLVLAYAPTAHAQSQSTAGFAPGYTDVGLVIGVGSIGDAGVSFGGRFEHAIKTLPSLGNGVLSFAVSIDHYHYDTPFGDFSYTPIGATASYHFHLEDKHWDPFAGIGLGDYLVSRPSGCNGCDFTDGVYVIGRLGLRYFVTPTMAIYGDVGSGAGSLHVGVVWKLKGGS